jgi:predicted sulfurtransferase
LGELLRSPGEQQTEIVQRQLPQMPFYRLDLKLKQDIALDDISRVNELQGYGERFAKQIDWESILAGRDNPVQI